MNIMDRERRSHARRTFIEITPGVRRALEALADASIELLDEIDAPAEGLEDGGDEEPTCGWTTGEAEAGAYVAGLDEGEDDDPAEDGHDAELEWPDSTLTLANTGGGFGLASMVCAGGEDDMRMREAFDPRLALRPVAPAPWRPGVYPRFPHEPADRPAFDLYGEIRRLRRVAVDAKTRKRRQRGRSRPSVSSRPRPGSKAR